MKRKIIFLVCIIVAFVSCGFIIYSKNKTNLKSDNDSSDKKEIIYKLKTNKNKENDKKEDTSKVKNITKEEVSSNKSEERKNTNEISNKADSTNKKNNSTITNDSSSGKTSSSAQTNSNNGNISNNKGEKPMTAWEKLGISEEQYNNAPGPNEGEIAFTGAETVCESVANSITRKYSLVTHVGDVKSRSERYIGCWITVHLSNGEWMFFNEFKEREKRGEFKTLTAD